MVSSWFTRVALFAFIASLPSNTVAAGSFRKVTPKNGAARVVIQEELMTAVLQSLAKLNAGEIQIQDIGTRLTSSWHALPKTSEGLLPGPTVRYMAHTYFMQEHGWVIRGLEPHSVVAPSKVPSRWDSIPTRWDNIPSFLLSILERHVNDRGLGLNAVVAFVALQGNLVVREGHVRLKHAYELNGLSINKKLSEFDLEKVLDSYMILLSSDNGDSVNATQHSVDRAKLHERWSDLPEMQAFSADSFRNMIFMRQGTVNPFVEPAYSFDDGAIVMESMIKKFGKVRNGHCQNLKDGLMQMDFGNTGRVPLKDFYAKKSVGHFSMGESAEYLRELGVLDESAPSLGPQVIIPNYVTAVSNCDSPSQYFSICCIHECEGLLKYLEVKVNAPNAKPKQILDLVTHMSSDTIEAPRNLTSQLVDALWQVAALHKGEVPLHSRLFAQWMHYAFPHECSYPYMTGKIKPMTPSEWLHEHGRQTQASEAEVRESMSQMTNPDVAVDQTYMSQWTLDEEMRTNPLQQSGVAEVGTLSVRTVLQLLAFIMGPTAFFLGILYSIAGTGKAMVFGRKRKLAHASPI